MLYYLSVCRAPPDPSNAAPPLVDASTAALEGLIMRNHTMRMILAGAAFGALLGVIDDVSASAILLLVMGGACLGYLDSRLKPPAAT